MKTPQNESRRLYAFLHAAAGSWRNTIYITCKSPAANCPCRDSCSGYLLAADRDGRPLLFPAEELQRLSGEAIDPAECGGILTRLAFERAFSLWIRWNVTSDKDCPLRALFEENDTSCIHTTPPKPP